MMKENQIRLKEASILNVPIYSYENDFTFIVNGEEFKTSKIISELISPKISHIHKTDPTINKVRIETRSKGDFSPFLKLATFESYQIPEKDVEFIYEVLQILGNDFIEHTLFENHHEMTKDTVLALLKVHEKSDTAYSKFLSSEINFVSMNFSEVVKHYEKELFELKPSTIERILSNEKLKIKDEDELISFINKLYQKDTSFSYLYESVIFTNLSKSKLTEFLQLFELENMNNQIWKSIKKCFENHLENDFFDERRYIQNHQGIQFKFKDINQFKGIFNYYNNQTGNHIEKVVKITSSSYENQHFRPENVILPKTQDDYFASKCIENSWVCFEFINHKVIPTNYTIGSTINSFKIRSWVVEGSADGKTWVVLDSQKNCIQMNNDNFVGAFDINDQNSMQFKFIRLRMTEPNWQNNEYLRLNSFEIYGTLC